MRRCCVSKARPPAVATIGGGAAADEDAPLAAELRSLKLSQLLSRAMAISPASLSETQIQQAQDSEEPRTALVALLLEAENAGSRGAEQRLCNELHGLRLTALSKRAAASRLSDTEIADAIDSDDPKGALTDLVVQAELGRVECSAALRKELAKLKRSELQKRARAAGVDQRRLEQAEDCEDLGKACSLIIDLICEQAAQDEGATAPVASAATAESEAQAALVSQLAKLKLKTLKQRAKACGVSQDQLDDTDSDDANDTRRAVIELIVSAELHPDVGASDTDRPHFGASDSAVGTHSASKSVAHKLSLNPATKHVMLSYQWDHQATVTRVYDILTKLGVKCWMDVKSGMGSDIYEGMAKAISNASVVVCFMSAKYQESANCMLEVKFAKQSGINMVPVIMESSGWRPSGWLGLITAGSLWVRLSDESQFDENIRQLYAQIQDMVGAAPDDIDERSDDAGVASATEAKAELDRLREDLDVKNEAGAVVAQLADPSQPATIPAGVPVLPAKFQITNQIQELTRLVLSTSDSDLRMPRVGFWGMGGIGKTVTGAAIVRNADVRRYFHAIIWLPFGQTPVIAKLQNLCYMQCMGKEMSPELSSEEKKQALQQAMKGKRVLLCLDDLWEGDHELELNFVDADAGSKVLISTRMQVLLDGAHQVEVGLPSPSDSARMLLAAAGVEDSSRRPSGVNEIVDLCGRLPLALGIAGRLAASLDIVGTNDWSGMIDVLKEELRQSHSGGAEEGMIRASLRGLKGSEAEQSNVKSLLQIFAMVPEDTYCPLEALLLIFNAVNTDAGATLMHIRKWLRILINRSLVLGTVDRPSVHDLVLDFAKAQHSDAELWEAHRRIVESFRASRPSDSHGRKQYDVSRVSSPVSRYVSVEFGHHIRMAMQQDKWCAVEWLQDVPQDSLTLAAGRCFGTEEISMMARRAEDARDWWLAARYWSLVRQLVFEASNNGPAQEPAFKSLHAISQMSHASDPEARDDLRFRNAQVIITAFDLPTVISRMGELEEILQLKAATREPAVTAGLRQFFNLVIPKRHDWRGNMDSIADNQWKLYMTLRTAISEEPDPVEQKRCRLMLMALHQTMDASVINESFDWDFLFGADGGDLTATVREYSYSQHHAFLISAINGDGLLMFPAAAPLLLHWGDMTVAEEVYERQLSLNRLCIQSIQTGDEVEGANEHIGIMIGLPAWAYHLHTAGIECGRETLRALQVEAGLTYQSAQATCNGCLTPWVRKRGDTTMNVFFVTCEFLTLFAQMGHILMATKGPGVSREEVLANMPSAEDIVAMVQTVDEMSNMEAFMGIYCSAFGACASVCEKYEEYERALIYVDYVLSADLAHGGTQLPICRMQHSMLKGRVLAALGRTAEAAETLETAAADAHHYGIYFYEVLSLRDLKLLVLDDLGHGEHGSRRLGAALRLLKGPANKLTPLLKGLDASDLVALPPPDARHEVLYEDLGKDTTPDALQNELVGMRLKGLRDRAKLLGVDDIKLEDAFDEDDCKAAVIALIIDASEAARTAREHLTKHETALRAQFEPLRLRALRERARDVGIDDDQLEDATDSDDPKGALVDLLVDTIAKSKSVLPGPEPEPEPEPEPAPDELAPELHSLRVMALHAQAVTEGIDMTTIEDTMDSDHPKRDLIKLILDKRTSETTSATIRKQDKLKFELESMRVMELHARAIQSVEASIIEDAMESDHPKRRLVELLLSASEAAVGS